MTVEEAHRRVRSWIAEEGLPFEEPRIDGDAWRLSIKDLNLATDICQSANSRDRIDLLGTVGVAAPVTNRINAMNEAEKAALLWDIRFALVGAGLDFGGVSHPLERVHIRVSVFYDGLTKDNLFRQWRQLRRAVLLVIWVLNKHMGEPPKFMSTDLVH